MNILKKKKKKKKKGRSLFHIIMLRVPVIDFHVKTGTRFSLRYKRLFEVSEVEITRVD